MKGNLALVLGFMLVATGCGGGEGEGESPSTSDSRGGNVTTTSAAGTTTTETSGPIDEPDTAGIAAFAINEVVFGDDGYVAVTNVGAGSGSLVGFQLCQRPSYFGIGDVTVAAGETVYFTTGSGEGLVGQVIEAGTRFGRLRASSGEIGLYSSGSFGSSEAIVSYLEWGSAGHGRSGVAVDAGIWVDGDFVITDEASTGVTAATAVPQSAGDWVAS